MDYIVRTQDQHGRKQQKKYPFACRPMVGDIVSFAQIFFDWYDGDVSNWVITAVQHVFDTTGVYVIVHIRPYVSPAAVGAANASQGGNV